MRIKKANLKLNFISILRNLIMSTKEMKKKFTKKMKLVMNLNLNLIKREVTVKMKKRKKKRTAVMKNTLMGMMSCMRRKPKFDE